MCIFFTHLVVMVLNDDCWYVVGTYCEIQSLFNLSATCRTQLYIQIPNIKKFKIIQDNKDKSETKTDTTTVNITTHPPNNMFSSLFSFGINVNKKKENVCQENFYNIFHNFYCRYFNEYYIHFFENIGIKIESWEFLQLYSNKQLEIIHNQKFYNLNKIVKTIDTTNFQLHSTLMSQIRKLPPELMHLLWSRCFKSVNYTSDNYKKFLGQITLSFLDYYRSELVINQKFLVLCFTHKLDNVLQFLIHHQKFFYIELNNIPSFYDNIIYLSCDLNYMNFFMNPIVFNHIKKDHIKYAMIHSNNDFLMSIWKIRHNLPINFNKVIHHLSLEKNNDSKQKEFIKWCINHP